MSNFKTPLLSLVGLCWSALCHADLPKAAVTLAVSDDANGKPLASAEARISFTVPDGKGGTKMLSRSGLTDVDGRFSAAENSLFYITASARKVGYYASGLSYDFKPTTGIHYEPLNPTIPIAKAHADQCSNVKSIYWIRPGRI